MSTSFESELARSGKLVYTTVGSSMLPMLRQRRDMVIITRRPEGRLRRYDVALYKRDTGRYVLHRVMSAGAGGYTMCGDNQWRREKGVEDRQIIGVLSAFVRDGREISVESGGYRTYVRLWCDFFWLRAAVLWCRSLPARLKRKGRHMRSDGTTGEKKL